MDEDTNSSSNFNNNSNNSNSNNLVASNVAAAIAAALDWTSAPDSRLAALSFIDSIKAGDVRVLANTSFILVRREWSSEIRLHAFKMLQDMVRLRWEELNTVECRNFANLASELISEVSNPSEEWALKSQTAALVAEIFRREGLELWTGLFPSLVTLSSQGPIQAELVAMMLRWLPEDITVHNEDLEGDRRRLLLRGLTHSLPEILPLLYNLLERHFGAALSEVGRQQIEIAKQHAAAVTATLNAINSYAEWAPVPDLAKYGIIHGCGFLLSTADFRLHACEFFKLVSPRKRPVDDSTLEFDSAMAKIFQILMTVSGEFLQKSGSNSSAWEDSEVEFMEYICESMVSLSSSNLQCISADIMTLSLYLQQMLGSFKHYKLALNYQSLPFWLGLMRDLLTKLKVAAGDAAVNNNTSSSFDRLDSEKTKILNLINDDMCSAILDVSFQRMIKKEKIFPGTSLPLGALELWSDDFEAKGDFSQYRSKLLELIRFIASLKPVIAGAKVSERIFLVVNCLLTSSNPVQELALMESVQVALENVVSAVFDGSSELAGGSSEVHLALHRIFEGLLQQLLSLKWTEPTLVEVLAHCIDAFGPFLKYFPDAVGSVIRKLFELLSSLPFIVKDPATSSARHARLQICMSFIRIAIAADKSVLPHMKGIADTMAHMQREGCLLRSEHNILGEAFLIMASAAGTQQQQEVLAWLLEPLMQQWTQQEWQNIYLSEPQGLIRLCSDKQFMWSIYHNVTFFEKALKRSGSKKGNSNLQYSSTTSTSAHLMASHLSWILPPLLKLLRALHSLWSPSVYQALPGELKAAMTMSDVERYSLLGAGNPKLSKLSFADGSQGDVANEGFSESGSDIRNWLKGTRDSAYNVLGLSTTIGDPFFKCVDVNSVFVALMENIQSMEFRHLRQLMHSVLAFLVKSCPSEMWEVWLEKLMHPLFVHLQQVLSVSWSSLLLEGRAKVPDAIGIVAGSDLKVEVMEEKLLRDLTRETCSLLATIASPALNTGLSSLDQSGHVSCIDPSSLKDLCAFASSSMVGFLLKNKSVAVPALQICLQVLTWTDGEAVSKVSSFCAAVVNLAITTDNSIELREFVSKDLFLAAIKGLELESNAIISADLIGLCREIFIFLRDRDPAPRQILLETLPCITMQDLVAFEEALGKTTSPKEQKQLMKGLLSSATGNKLRALLAQKSVNLITNVTTSRRSTYGAPETRPEGDEAVGLAAIL